MKNRRHWQVAAVSGLCFVGTLLSPQPVSGQGSGEVHAAFVHGGQSSFRMTGVVGGGGVFIRNRFGIDAEVGLLDDSSDERVLAPVLADKWKCAPCNAPEGRAVRQRRVYPSWRLGSNVSFR